jgi:hypothetical protein
VIPQSIAYRLKTDKKKEMGEAIGELFWHKTCKYTVEIGAKAL